MYDVCADVVAYVNIHRFGVRALVFPGLFVFFACPAASGVQDNFLRHWHHLFITCLLRTREYHERKLVEEVLHIYRPL